MYTPTVGLNKCKQFQLRSFEVCYWNQLLYNPDILNKTNGKLDMVATDYRCHYIISSLNQYNEYWLKIQATRSHYYTRQQIANFKLNYHAQNTNIFMHKVLLYPTCDLIVYLTIFYPQETTFDFHAESNYFHSSEPHTFDDINNLVRPNSSRSISMVTYVEHFKYFNIFQN